MSRSTTGDATPRLHSPDTGPSPPVFKTWMKKCALLPDETNDVLFGGKSLGVETDVTTMVTTYASADSDPWMGFIIHFPLGASNEDDGFGIVHKSEKLDRLNSSTKPTEVSQIVIKFPRGQTTRVISALHAGKRDLFPGVKGGLSILDVSLVDDAIVQIEGFGMPFANPGHPAEDWILKGLPIAAGKTLLDILEQRSFQFVINSPPHVLEGVWDDAKFPQPFSYPYGTDHTWNESKFQSLLERERGHQFAPCWGFREDNEHLAALVHSQVQDVMWVHNAAQAIGDVMFRAYFVTIGDNEIDQYFAIIPQTLLFREQFDSAWCRLIKDGTLQLRIWDDGISDGEVNSALWDAKMIDHPKSLDALSSHPLEKYDLVLMVRRAMDYRRGPDFEVKTFGDRASADYALQQDKLPDYRRKVYGVCRFHPDADVSNPAVFGLPEIDPQDPESHNVPIPAGLRYRMSMHRDLVRGTGFWKTLRYGTVHPARGLSLPSLPVSNLLNISEEYIEALMQEALPEDRTRFRNYLSERTLGLGVITAGPGFGKTTALALATLGMSASLGKIYASAPTHVAVDNFTARLDLVTTRVTDRLNQGKQGSSRTFRKLVVRAYAMGDETYAAWHLLKNPDDGDNAARSLGWTGTSKWKLHLSLAYWTLMVLRSPVVRELGEDDCPALHEIQAKVDRQSDLKQLRALAVGTISWEQYQAGSSKPIGDPLRALMASILDAVDILGTTPALSCQVPFVNWKNRRALGIAIDEAGNISRPDLYCVWGNTLLPCLLAGDDKQLGPAVMTMEEKDAEGLKYLNRFGQDGKISALLWFKGTGWPVYRLRTQLRMATGLFELCHSEVYSDLPFTYGLGCDVSLPAHRIGRQLELFVQQQHGGVAPAATGTLQPVFVHCEGSYCVVDEVTGSRKNRGQVEAALGFLCDFVKSAELSPAEVAKVVIISPYKANTELIERMRKRPAYTVLSSIPPAATIDSFQGQEGDIVVVITGTTQKVGPGFTTDERRLNVMLSRQKNGLVIFGDLNAAGRLDGGGGRGKTKGKGKDVRFQVKGANGEMYWTKASMLRNVYKKLLGGGRVIRIDVTKTAPEAGG
ncbi:hypothetical protein AK830_g1349 [Neonectria ditissima]|uniref:DNA2/NAM7 helicase-like C-terminal domain-containing protein n=1 Tax=Neonectria ditissima TaxID=78410 RepID=A0A0N8H8P9_9HYPO|nr:hypothetical protein AK830_g1349 [Neonectria ditissima]